MTYCKYCYRILDDGTEICAACGKTQNKKASLRNLWGFLPIRNKERFELTVAPVSEPLLIKTKAKESNQVIINGVPIPRKILVAMQLHSTLGIFPPDESRFDPMTKHILKKCNNDRKSILLAEVELCKPFETPMSYCIIANAYHFLGAAYRQETIQYMTKYLDNPAWMPHIDYFEGDRERYLSGRWDVLGLAYEGEYMFEEALQAYIFEKDIAPEYPAAYVRIATVLSKMNRLDAAISFLKEAQATQYYRDPSFGTSFNTVIDNYLSKFEEKKKRNYIYKPRPRKTKK